MNGIGGKTRAIAQFGTNPARFFADDEIILGAGLPIGGFAPFLGCFVVIFSH
jgi:hypothetical protein